MLLKGRNTTERTGFLLLCFPCNSLWKFHGKQKQPDCCSPNPFSVKDESLAGFEDESLPLVYTCGPASLLPVDLNSEVEI